jgi:hypothetical protein
MSIVSDARTYADTALEQGKSTFTFAQGRLLSLTSDARERATSIAGDTRGLALGAVGLARRQAYAAIGATDALFASITKRAEDFPGGTKRNATKLVDTTKARINLAGEIAESARKIDLGATTATAKDEVDSRVEQVKTTFGKLADRGEKVAAELRQEPIVVRVLTDAETVVERAANEVTAVAQKVRSRTSSASPAPVTKAPARKAPAKKAPARVAPTTAPAAGAPAAKTPAKKAPSSKPTAQ